MSDLIKIFFENLYNLKELIHWGGYTVLTLIVFSETGLLIGFFLPGDSLLVTAGVIAATTTGILDINYLIMMLCAAAIIGDTTGYSIGYKAGHALFTREDSIFFKKSHLIKTKAFYEKHGGKTIIIARFIPIIRTFAPVIAGVGEMSYPKFLAYNVIGGIGWVVSMCLIGYFIGNAFPLHIVVPVVIFISLLPMVYEYYKAYSEKKKIKLAELVNNEL
ncbi:MAG TPA: VTT domain-containing protein [Candidatus Wallbacteria bacterium]|nr:VTT domain-containing protein [Candidatus Wallbacteria bacterium]